VSFSSFRVFEVDAIETPPTDINTSVIEKHHDHPPSYETEILTALSCARAFETETVWAMCNAGGPAEERFIGGSGVWMPLKGKLAGLDGSEGMKVVTVDLGVLRVSGHHFIPAKR
jgi:predicted amidohydrolase